MRIKHDHEANAAYIRLSDLPVSTTTGITDGCIIDYALDGSIVGIELLNVRNVVTLESSCRLCKGNEPC